MALTESNMMPLGTPAPEFSLLDTISEKTLSLDELKSDKATVIMFICNHCPYVKYIQETLVSVAKKYQKQGVTFVAISSNDAENYPEDAPDKMKTLAQTLGFSFPYLYDENQTTAKAFHAACTPEFYIFDQSLLCVYRGRFDDSSPGKSTEVSGKDLSQALDNLLQDKSIHGNQKPSMGCNIKWKN